MAEGTAAPGGESTAPQGGEGTAPAEAPAPKRTIKPIKSAADGHALLKRMTGGDSSPDEATGGQKILNEFGVVNSKPKPAPGRGKIEPPKPAKGEEGGEEAPKGDPPKAPPEGEKKAEGKPDTPKPAPPEPGDQEKAVHEHLQSLAKDADGKITWAGRRFNSPEEAEHFTKTLIGMHKSVEALRRTSAEEAETVRKSVERAEAERAQAVAHGNGWMAHAQALEARLRNLEAGGQASLPASTPADGRAANPPTATPSGEGWSFNPDFDNYRKLADEQPDAALTGLLNDFAKGLLEEMDRRQAERIQPFEQADQEAAEKQAVVKAWSTVRGMTNPAGEPLFPELADNAIAKQVAELWKARGLRPDPADVIAMVGLNRILQDQTAKQAEVKALLEQGVAEMTNPEPPAAPPPSDQGSPVIVGGKTLPAQEAGAKGKMPFDFMDKKPRRNASSRLRDEFGIRRK